MTRKINLTKLRKLQKLSIYYNMNTFFNVTNVKFFEEREAIGYKNDVIVMKRPNAGTTERGQSCNLFR
jgi:hypothetical protein